VSDEHSQEDKTEDPSDKRLRQAREEGNIPLGRDVVALAGLMGGAVSLLLLAAPLRDSLLKVVIASGQTLETGRPGTLVTLALRPLLLSFVVFASAAVAAGVASVAQTGGAVWPQLALPDPQRLFQTGKLSRLVKKETLVDFAFQLVKIVAVSATLWFALRDDFFALPRLLQASPGAQLTALFQPLAGALVKVLTALAFLAGLDLALSRYRYRQKMKMTKEEAKREYKEEEGDPIFRSKRKRMHRDMLKGVAKVEVPRADALIVNPIHVAIAIRYRPGEDRAPKVTAKGKGVLAELMRELARDNGVPIVENIPLARLLYRKVKIGRSVPADTFKAVAAILAFVYRVLGRDMSAYTKGRR
jgi:flagellar biosynthesis protein FlhB